MTAPVARILARYIAGLLMGYGVFSADHAESLLPEFEFILGAVIGIVAEAAYGLAVKNGWAK